MMRILAVTGLFLLFLTRGMAAGPTTARFGFSGPEIFPIDAGIGQLKSADMNGDGLPDSIRELVQRTVALPRSDRPKGLDEILKAMRRWRV